MGKIRSMLNVDMSCKHQNKPISCILIKAIVVKSWIGIHKKIDPTIFPQQIMGNTQNSSVIYYENWTRIVSWNFLHRTPWLLLLSIFYMYSVQEIEMKGGLTPIYKTRKDNHDTLTAYQLMTHWELINYVIKGVYICRLLEETWNHTYRSAWPDSWTSVPPWLNLMRIDFVCHDKLAVRKLRNYARLIAVIRKNIINLFILFGKQCGMNR